MAYATWILPHWFAVVGQRGLGARVPDRGLLSLNEILRRPQGWVVFVRSANERTDIEQYGNARMRVRE